MPEDPKTRNSPQRMTPLWLISLFLSLTEVVTGIAVTKATGNIQIALTTFVIAFPALVAAAFFAILWFRPYVLYPPAEFSGGSDVAGYVSAMRNAAATVRADLVSEVANTRASTTLSINSLTSRVDVVEGGLTKLLEAQQDAHAMLDEFRREKQIREKVAIEELSSFEQNAKYHIEVVGLSLLGAPAGDSFDRAREIAKQIAGAGFTTSVRGWNRDYYLSQFKRVVLDSVFLVHRGKDAFIVERLRSVLGDLAPRSNVVVLTAEEAARLSIRMSADTLLSPEFDAAVVFDQGTG